MPVFDHGDLRLHYAERGAVDGPPVVLLHGLLWSAPMFERLAGRLPGRRVLLLDLHGHGKSDKPTDADRYTWGAFADDVVALLDHLGLDRAVVGGLSLGANVTLAAAIRHPERMAGLVVEMPVLSRGEQLARTAFGRLARVYAGANPALTRVAGILHRVPVPRQLPELAAARDVAAAQPAVAAAVLEGLLGDRPPGDDLDRLATFTAPTLVIGHRRDPLHVLDDARDLVDRLPNARLVVASSIAEFRLHPDRLAAELVAFLDRVEW